MRGCGRIERPAFPAPSFQREPDQRANLAQKHAARSRTYAQCAPLPPRALARGGEGVGVGGLSAFFSWREDAETPPPPHPPPAPSPPLRGGRGATAVAIADCLKIESSRVVPAKSLIMFVSGCFGVRREA